MHDGPPGTIMNRREFLSSAGKFSLAAAVVDRSLLWATRRPPADYTIRIAPLTLELSPRRTVRTMAYNGVVPGPLIRLTEGKPVTIDVVNDTGDEELVHFHGLMIPSEVD